MRRRTLSSWMLGIAVASAIALTGCDDVLGEFQKGLKGAETPAYSIVLDGVDGETYVFETVDTKLALLVVNSGDEATGALTAELTGDSEAFTLSKTKLPSIKAGKSGKLIVAPVAELEAGVYKAAVVLSGEAGIAATLDVSFAVEEAEATEEDSATEGTEDAKEPEAAKTYTVTFDSQGGSKVEPQVVAKSGDTTIALATAKRPANPVLDGYLFDGWYTHPNGSGSPYDFFVTEDITVYANWVAITEGATYGISLTGREDGLPLRSYSFAASPADCAHYGWYSVLVKNTGNSRTGELAITLSGSNPDAFKLNYNHPMYSIPKGGKESFTIAPIGMLSAGTYTATVTVSGANGNGISESFDVSFTALPNDKNYYTITFDLNYAVALNPPASQTVAHGDTVINLANPTRVGYAFDGWYTDAAGITRWNFNTPVTDNITLYAKWTPVVYTVTFNTQDGSGAAERQTVPYGCKPAQPVDPTRVGYVFDGWYADAALTTRYDFANAIVTEDITLYAKWIAAE